MCSGACNCWVRYSTLRDLPQLPYVQCCGSSFVVIARRFAAKLASSGAAFNRLTDQCSFGILPLNTYIPVSAVTDANAHKQTHNRAKLLFLHM